MTDVNDAVLVFGYDTDDSLVASANFDALYNGLSWAERDAVLVDSLDVTEAR